MFNVGTLLEIFLADIQTRDYFSKLVKYQDFWSIIIWTKGILLYFTTSIFTISIHIQSNL
jgi:hypothetical protein